MSILGDSRIRDALARGEIIIEPAARDESGEILVGSNSIDLHLSRHLAVYLDCQEWISPMGAILRSDRPGNVGRFEIDPNEGEVLLPGELYLGSTVEHTSSGPYLPTIEGTSGAGRLGISVHATAGIGDVGFLGHFTLEISVVRPVRVFGGEPICQIMFWTVEGDVRVPYGKKKGANYQNQGPLPQPSRLWTKPRFLG